jgi:flagellar motility protein MotE (MotC chaperone)
MAAATHRRLLPAALGAMGVLLAVKLAALAETRPEPVARAPRLVNSANASEPRAPAAPQRAANAASAAASAPAAPLPAPGGGSPAQCGPEAQQATPEQRAERELLQALRARRAELDAKDQARRAELDAKEQALVTREVVAEATERRAAQKLEELSALQRQAASGDRERSEREEAGWRQMVKLYEGLRPREAAAIFDELDLAVLVPLVDRLRESKAAPILGAMRPERARTLTAELARHRSRARD